jgi:uncharacterized protein (TIGR00251 family)
VTAPGLNAHERDGGVTLDIIVAPRASRPGLGPVVGDRLRVAVTAPPVDGAANAAVIDTFARALGIPRARITIVRGSSGRRKTLQLAGVTLAALLAVVDTTK